MSETDNFFYFKCSVSEDLFGVSLNADGSPLPTPGGGSWITLENFESLGKAKNGFKKKVVQADVSKWGCHWFSSKGPTEIIWGDEKPPVTAN